jgi:hypothetical protein
MYSIWMNDQCKLSWFVYSNWLMLCNFCQSSFFITVGSDSSLGHKFRVKWMLCVHCHHPQDVSIICYLKKTPFSFSSYVFFSYLSPSLFTATLSIFLYQIFFLSLLLCCCSISIMNLLLIIIFYSQVC